MMQPAGATTRHVAIDARAVVAGVRRFILGRPDLVDLLSRQSRLLPPRVFPDVDSSGESFLDIYLEEHLSFFELVRPHLRPGLRVLEVGGGYGFFHVLAAAAGAAIVSIEPSDAGFSLFRAVALPVVEAFTGRTDRYLDVRVEDFDAADGSCDLVVSNNVLEHVTDVRRVMAAMYRVTVAGGLQVHHCPNYLFPYEPHYKVPILPCAVRLSGELCWRRFRRDPLWHSLNGINALGIRRMVRQLPGATLTFRNAAAFTLDRLRSERHLAARHGRLTRLALAPAVQRLLTLVPPPMMSPMIFEIRKAS
jgi:SAM-dependent methyltransferase